MREKTLLHHHARNFGLKHRHLTNHRLYNYTSSAVIVSISKFINAISDRVGSRRRFLYVVIIDYNYTLKLSTLINPMESSININK